MTRCTAHPSGDPPTVLGGVASHNPAPPDITLEEEYTPRLSIRNSIRLVSAEGNPTEPTNPSSTHPDVPADNPYMEVNTTHAPDDDVATQGRPDKPTGANATSEADPENTEPPGDTGVGPETDRLGTHGSVRESHSSADSIATANKVEGKKKDDPLNADPPSWDEATITIATTTTSSENAPSLPASESSNSRTTTNSPTSHSHHIETPSEPSSSTTSQTPPTLPPPSQRNTTFSNLLLRPFTKLKAFILRTYQKRRLSSHSNPDTRSTGSRNSGRTRLGSQGSVNSRFMVTEDGEYLSREFVEERERARSMGRGLVAVSNAMRAAGGAGKGAVGVRVVEREVGSEDDESEEGGREEGMEGKSGEGGEESGGQGNGKDDAGDKERKKKRKRKGRKHKGGGGEEVEEGNVVEGGGGDETVVSASHR